MLYRIYRKILGGNEDLRDGAVRRRAGIASEAIACVSLLILYAVKMILGLSLHSIAVRGDAIHNLGLAAACLFRIIDLLRADRRGTEKEKKGLRNAEYIVSFVTAFVLFELSFSYFIRAIAAIPGPAEFTGSILWAFVLAGLIVFRFYFSSFAGWAGRKLNRRPILMLANHARYDGVYTALTVLVLLFRKLFSWNLDSFAALVTTLAAMWSAVSIAIDAVRSAIEEKVSPELIRNIRQDIREYDGVIGIGSLSAKFYGRGRHLVSVRIKVPREIEAAETEKLVHTIEEEIGEKHGVTLVLHVDPIETGDEELLLTRSALETALENYDESISFDHFHIVRGRSFTNLIFDLYVPAEYNDDQKKDITNFIRRTMRERNPRYSCVISVEGM